MKKIVVFGASGFIGGHLLEYFLNNYEYDDSLIYVLARKNSKIFLNNERINFFETDFFNIENIEKTVYDANYVYYLLGATKGIKEEDFIKNNVFITENVFKALLNAKNKNKLNNFKRFLFVSSLAVNGDSFDPNLCKTEDDPYNPIEFYGKSKMLAEEVCKKYFGIFPITIIRPSAVFGERDKDFLNGYKLIKNNFKIFFGNQNKFFSYIYVKDLVEGIIKASISCKTINQTYFLTNKNIITWSDFYKKVQNILNKKRCITINIPIFFLDIIAFFGEIYSKIFKKNILLNKQKIKLGKANHFICSYEKAKKDFGFIAKTDIDEALKKTLSYHFKIK